jgi:SAM-dependent methyltransferase
MPPMSIGHLRALRVLHRTFRHYSPSARLHILIRYFTAPFLRTLDLVPRGARMLDIGAGHGTFARLAIENGAREVIAVEPDLRKSMLPLRDPRIRVVAAFDDAIRGEFDVVSIYDATYRIPLPEREKLYAHVRELLRPGGLFILKDMDPRHRWKMKWARLQERISDRFLRISLGEGFIYEDRRQIEDRLRRLGFVDFTERKIDFGYPHSHVVYTARRPDPAP